MPEVKYENDEQFLYLAGQPIQDRHNHPVLVPRGNYVRLTGVDGRYSGSFRRFPGFQYVTSLGSVPVVTGDTVGVTTVYFFKHITVHVPAGVDANDVTLTGATSRTFRGFVVAHDYTDTTEGNHQRGVLRFLYYDAEASAWKQKILLREVYAPVGGFDHKTDISTAHARWTNSAPVIGSNSQIDAAAMGPFLYFCVSRGTPQGDEYVSGDLGEAPVDYYRKSVYVRTNAAGNDAVDWWFTDLGPLHNPATDIFSFTYRGQYADYNLHGDSTIKQAGRMYSGIKNTNSPLVGALEKTTASVADNSIQNHYLEIRKPSSPGSTVWSWLWGEGSAGLRGINQRGLDDENMRPKWRVYRSLESYWFENQNFDMKGTILGGTLFRDKDITVAPVSGNLTPSIPGTDQAGYGNQGDDEKGGIDYFLSDRSDFVLATSERIDPFEDDTARAPDKITLLLPYQGTLLRIGRFPRPARVYTIASTDNDLSETAPLNHREDVLSWGSLKKYAPEEFSIGNSTPLGTHQDDHILSLVSAGDFAFAIGDSGVYRIVRNGVLMGINTVQNQTGGAHRYGSLGVGNTLYFVAKSGMWAIDGPSGNVQVVGALDRIITDEWATSLSSVRMCLDQRLGAVFLLNTDTSKQEAVVMWTTGMITTLKDLPFSFCTEGVNPSDGGDHRSFWIMPTGEIWSPNADRTGALAMCGGETASKDWNGIAASGATTTTVSFSGASRGISTLAVGFKIRFLSGNVEGQSSTITAVNSPGVGSVTFSPALTEPPDSGVRMSIAPVPFEVIGWPLQGGRGFHPFRSKVAVAMSHSVTLDGGDTGTSNPNVVVDHRVYTRGNVTTPVKKAVGVNMNVNPGKNYSNVTLRGPTLLPAWYQGSSNLDFQLLAGIVDGKITASESETSPAATL